MLERVRVIAPASCANLGPGFDVFALALSWPYDKLELSYQKSDKFEISLTVKGNVPREKERNAVSYVIEKIAEEMNLIGKLTAKLEKGVPVGVGLGSSAASSVAASFGMNALFSLGLSVKDMIRYASYGEKLCSGYAHLDNVTASLLGGFTIAPVYNEEPLNFDAPEKMDVTVVIPEIKLPRRKTEYARKLVPKHVHIEKHVSNLRNACIMAVGFATSSLEKIGLGMEDKVVEVARSKMYPYYGEIKRKSLDLGAEGVCISGAGPAVLILSDPDKVKANELLDSAVEGYRSHGIVARGFITKAGKGAKLIEQMED